MPSPPRPGSRCVLIVENDEDCRELMEELLRTFGHRTLVAGSVAEAIEVSSGEHPDVALIDLGLPDGDGCSIARSLRGSHRGTALQLVAISGSSDSATRRLAAEAGFDRYIVKPLNPGTLHALLGD
jgi:DNA-binding response OmpR family regulator